MYRLTSSLTLYSAIPADSILFRLADIVRDAETNAAPVWELASRYRAELRRLLELSARYGFTGCLWQDYLAYLLLQTETPYGLVKELSGNAGEPFGLARDLGDSTAHMLDTLAAMDFEIFAKLFAYDFTALEAKLGLCLMPALTAPAEEGRTVTARCINELAESIAKQPDQIEMLVKGRLLTFGCGDFAMYRAFRLAESAETRLEPIRRMDQVTLSDLVGYELQKAQIRANVDAFVDGKPFNNMLLYGDAGTGKSTTVRALLTEYSCLGLRLVEVDKNHLDRLSAVIDLLRDRNYYFVVVLDDLSFDAGETGYKYLKSVIEGGIGERPRNIMICATSNRRHLIRESWSDRSDMEHDDDIHRSDTVEEKLSLAARFGCSVNFNAPDRKLFRQIVSELAKRHPEITLDEDALFAAANRWEIRHGGLSGRTAKQFVDALAAGQI